MIVTAVGSWLLDPDHYLYIALGDGSPYGDILGNAQNRSSLLGKILRIDVKNPFQGRNYGISADNPFEGNTADYREKIYALWIPLSLAFQF